MRIWDLPPSCLCRQHLLGEHRELHALWSILVNGKKGYSRHPETLRWRGKLAALYRRHEELMAEMARRGYRHKTPLDKRRACGLSRQDEFLQTPESQAKHLRRKSCGCSPAPTYSRGRPRPWPPRSRAERWAGGPRGWG